MIYSDIAALMGVAQLSVGKKRANIERIGFGRDSAIGRTSVAQAYVAPALTLFDESETAVAIGGNRGGVKSD